MVKVNEQVPDLEFNVFHKGRIIKKKLSDFSGKWLVLLFYPADFTFVCPTELEDAALNYDKFQESDAEIVSFSTDTAYVHLAWHEQSKAVGKVKFPMGADPTGKICRAFGTYIEEEGVSLRATFIIDPDGVLKSIEMHDNSIGRSSREYLRKLQAAKHVSEHGEQACPANWQPGKKTLKPGEDLVGKL
jgi:peroxiredoxin (alkyl hydroperoxide reductase subunit C)